MRLDPGQLGCLFSLQIIDYQAVMMRTERFTAFQGETDQFINSEAGHTKLHTEQQVATIVIIPVVYY